MMNLKIHMPSLTAEEKNEVAEEIKHTLYSYLKWSDDEINAHANETIGHAFDIYLTKKDESCINGFHISISLCVTIVVKNGIMTAKKLIKKTSTWVDGICDNFHCYEEKVA